MIELTVDGTSLQAPEGQSLGAVLLSAGRTILRDSPSGTPRGLFCGIGVCQECRVVVDGTVTRACVTPVTAGMRVTTGHT
ncbi:(2Fe-2S)-binding protein [Solirubrobacter sp. CPCC 204708]|uniref:(2Fe-2S)-binding protein n=1 Tax=Solirubrobacter deserti TaxID=2282478 RepID=A0ABT4RBW2_9ACTN|nr:(2Fe-2S)-binding protein [Solirubrobacter deserti]MBE2317098.1 (2Fe-2S)-binding protein [Solirubrobacter deserti]MDA0136010.1 (2Fe-2S)-binding protein [Solirubrobacter deserti]